MLAFPNEAEVSRRLVAWGEAHPIDPRAHPHQLPSESRRHRRSAVRLRPDRRRHRLAAFTPNAPGCRRTAGRSLDGVTDTSSTGRRRPSSGSSMPTASRSTTPSGRTLCSSASRKPKGCQRISTSATACSSTRTGGLGMGSTDLRAHIPAPPTERSIARSSRSSGGTRHTSPRPSGAARSSSPSSHSTTTRSSSRYAASSNGGSSSTTTGRCDRVHTDAASKDGSPPTSPLSSRARTSGRRSRRTGTPSSARRRSSAELPGEVGDALGYAYPLDVDEAVTAHLESIRQLPSRHGGQ